ncbi:MAG TPA: amidase domain-containing protein [Chondromyces sp.]|nr:amidase domain-containing protein [Chondromyces sp.]
MKQQLQKLLQARVSQCVGENEIQVCEKMKLKTELAKQRNAEIVKVAGTGRLLAYNEVEAEYSVHLKYLVKQGKTLYMEEEIEYRKASFHRGILMKDIEILPEYEMFRTEETVIEFDERVPFTYDRMKAVQYAERWWNDHNPAYKKFNDDCTNYISQCLHAGGAPMWGQPNRSKGWWMQRNNWSYSWTVAHSFRWYLGTSKTGLRSKEVDAPERLKVGDIICYDFQGDGRFDHTTIVTARDENGMPLVNAHTTNSRMRYWSYEDSTAYTPQIQYKFFAIIDDQS